MLLLVLLWVVKASNCCWVFQLIGCSCADDQHLTTSEDLWVLTTTGPRGCTEDVPYIASNAINYLESVYYHNLCLIITIIATEPIGLMGFSAGNPKRTAGISHRMSQDVRLLALGVSSSWLIAQAGLLSFESIFAMRQMFGENILCSLL